MQDNPAVTNLDDNDGFGVSDYVRRQGYPWGISLVDGSAIYVLNFKQCVGVDRFEASVSSFADCVWRATHSITLVYPAF